MSAQSEGEYAEALLNYYEAMRLEIDPYDRSYILYNIGLIHTSNGEHAKALEYYFQALERNPSLPQALNNMAVICHYVRLFVLIYLWDKNSYCLSINNKFITCISNCDI
jgi:tetratricopeptide (TPR) repeat protein